MGRNGPQDASPGSTQPSLRGAIVFDRWFQRLPDDVGLTILPSGKRLRITPRDTLLQSALAQGLAFPHNCRVGGCGECKCRLVEGKVKELTDKSYVVLTRSAQAGVNLDEEAARMMQFQQAYQAAARVLQTAQTLFNETLQLAGR